MNNHELIILDEGSRDALFYKQPNGTLGPDIKLSGTEQNDVEEKGSREAESAQDARQGIKPMYQEDEADKVSDRESKSEDSTPSAVQLQQQITELCSKVTSLETFSFRNSSNIEDAGREECGLTLGIKDRQRFEETIRDLTKREREREETINNLLNTQESLMRMLEDSKGLDDRYKTAIGLLEKEKRVREENELNLRSEIATTYGLYRKEKERAQKLMKTMAEMQNADPFKLDNNNITSFVKELRYNIKNWARAQRLVPSHPTHGVITTYASRALGVREKGPNYEFLKEITPNYQEYTESPQDFKLLLQAYVWKRIIEMIFFEDLWAGTRKSLDDDDTDHKLQVGYRSMKQRLQPGQ